MILKDLKEYFLKDSIKKHLKNIFVYFDSYITNAVSEGLNSRIQSIKANSRGYRNFENYRISLLFFCGKLDMHPQ
jgi:transposase